MHKIKAAAQPIVKILKISALWSGHAHPKYDNDFAALMELNLHTKNQKNTKNLLFQYTLGMPENAWPRPQPCMELSSYNNKINL